MVAIQKFKGSGSFIYSENAFWCIILIVLKTEKLEVRGIFFKSKILDRGCDWNVPVIRIKSYTGVATLQMSNSGKVVKDEYN